MSTTTIRLPEDLKAQVADASEHAGTTQHNFILQAIAEKTAREELSRNFDEEAEKRYTSIIANGETISWHDMRYYLESHLAGNICCSKPEPKKLGR